MRITDHAPLQLFLTGYLHGGGGDDGLQQMRWICLNKIPTRARRFKPRKLTMLDLNAAINLLREEDVAQYQGLHAIKYSMAQSVKRLTPVRGMGYGT